MQSIKANIPTLQPPAWAIAQRDLLALQDRAVDIFLDRYIGPDGQLSWGHGTDDWQSRDGVDDFYEPYLAWPLLYLMGGDNRLLQVAHQRWEAVTRQLTGLGRVHKEYELGYDQFHQAEGYLLWDFLCLADPSNPLSRDRSRRFAGFYLGDDPEAPNYDSALNLIRAPHNGSGGPRWGYLDGDPVYPWNPGMVNYGLPYADIPGITSFEDLKDPELARRMGEAMQDRMGRGDVAANLPVTTLVTNTYLQTGDDRYRDWVVRYVDGWMERAAANGGLLPDNVGLSGRVGEYLDGRWYGGLYGWTWPHGYHNLCASALVAAANALLLTGDPSYLDLPRAIIDRVWENGEWRDPRSEPMSLRHHWVEHEKTLAADSAFLVPYRYGDAGWFDFQPLSPVYPTTLWMLSQDPADWERIERIRKVAHDDWRTVRSHKTKEDSGHEAPWLRFIANDNPGYPEAALMAARGVITRRIDLIRSDKADPETINIHHWQEHVPTTTEALVQLTLGGPQPLLNGGLLHTRLRWFDGDRRRPGLPPDVAALVETIEPTRTVVRLVNLDPFAPRTAIVQAGAFGEHRFASASFEVRTSDYPGSASAYAAPPLQTETATVPIDGHAINIQLPPATEIRLDLTMDRYARRPSYAAPWD